MTQAPPSRLRQIRALTRAFLARFFENELTSGTNDLRASFFWLVAMLAPIGIFMPWLMVFSYQQIFYTGGANLVRAMTQADKTLYLGYSMVTSGAVAVVVWNSVLIDRRDALVLGTLPVSGSTMVVAKLLALGGYVGIIALGTHLGASISFGFVLGNWSGLDFAARNMWAHFIASCFSSAFVVFSVAGTQGLLLAIAGPRLFGKLSPLLQLALAALVLTTLFFITTIAGAVVDTMGVRPAATWFAQGKGAAQPWILSTPILWFLGLYEYLLGDPMLPVMPGLATKAVIAVGISFTAVLATYPLAYRRLMRSAVEGVGLARVPGRGMGASEWIARVVGRSPGVRAAVQFFLASLGRVERHRFVLAITGGLACVFGLPALLTVTRGLGASSLAKIELLCAPMSVITVLLIGLRIAASLPSDPKAGWVFALLDPPSQPSRAASARVCFVLAVLPTLVVFTPFLWSVFGPARAIAHATLLAASGGLITEALFMRADAVPCSQPWPANEQRWRGWWALRVFGFVIITRVVPIVSLSSAWQVAAVGAFLALGIAAVLHSRARRVQHATYTEADMPTTLHVLDLN